MRVVETDKRSSRGHLGLGKIAALRSHPLEAKTRFARAFQLDPRDPDVILAFTTVMEDRKARQTLLRNFLALTPDRERARDVQAKLDIEERLGERTLAALDSPYRSYRLVLESFEQHGKEHGLVVRVKLNGGKEQRLVLDSGATGISSDRVRQQACRT